MITGIFADRLAKKMARGQDSIVPIISVYQRNLDSFGLLIVGLWLFLRHLGEAFFSIRCLTLYRQGSSAMPVAADHNIRQLTNDLIPCLPGIGLALGFSNLGH